MALRWTGLFGDWELLSEDGVRGLFRGKEVPWTDPQGVLHHDGSATGIALCDAAVAGGTVQTKIAFAADTPLVPQTSAGIVLWASTGAAQHLVAGFNLVSGGLAAVRGWNGKAWLDYEGGTAGALANLRLGHAYEVTARLEGSAVSLSIDGIELVRTEMPAQLPPGPVGVWAMSKADVEFSDFHVEPRTPTAFAVMQFTSPYNELFEQVIRPICREFGIDAQRADDTHGPGVIMQDIVRQMVESSLVIAEITPANPNVYYEVGYAHALGKPTILIAEAGVKLPFDLSGLRTLFYENSIDGKSRMEDRLRKHLTAILSATRHLR